MAFRELQHCNAVAKLKVGIGCISNHTILHAPAHAIVLLETQSLKIHFHPHRYLAVQLLQRRITWSQPLFSVHYPLLLTFFCTETLAGIKNFCLF